MENTNSKKQERVILNKAGRPYNEFELEVKKAGKLVLNDRYLFKWDEENDSIVFLNSLKEEKSNKNYAVKSLKEERSISPEDKAPEDKNPEPPKQEPKEDNECFVDLGNGLEVWDKKEYFKHIEGYEGRYMVSTFGNIYSLISGKELAAVKEKSGYLRVGLVDSKGNYKRFLVHRLVAQAFLPNEDNLPQVNHKDEIITNCRVDNLEWCSVQYNTKYSLYQREREVAQIDVNTNEVVNTFKSLSEAARESGIGQGNISKCCKGLINQAGGFRWEYTKAYDPLEQTKREVEKYDLKTNKALKTYKSSMDAARNLDLGDTRIDSAANKIRQCCKGTLNSYKGYGWRYKD